MIYTQLQLPGVARWQSRLARVPRWVWVTFFVGVMVPIVAVLMAAIAFGLIFVAVAVAMAAVIGFVYRLFHRRCVRRGEIVVRMVRVVDP